MKLALLVELLRNPALAETFTDSQWEKVVSQARRALLLGSLEDVLKRHGLVASIPTRVSAHIASERAISLKQASGVGWEVRKLIESMGSIGAPAILLKGAAYIVSELPAANGRLLSDIDILVAEDKITEAEAILTAHGWMPSKMDAYDQRYFREWMHEIPPMTHIKTGTTLDVHHTILPLTAKSSPSAKLIIDSIRPAVMNGAYVLAPEDMVIHSATHLFHEGELEHGLRGLVDLDALCSDFGAREPGFWDRLVPRAEELDLLRPIYYGLHYANLILGTAIPEKVMCQATAGKPPAFVSVIMDTLYRYALMPDHPSCDRLFTPIARWLLYVRAHYLRMPLHLLVPHLVRKAWKRRFRQAGEYKPVVEDN